MKITAYDVREDEREHIDALVRETGFEIVCLTEPLTLESADLAAGSDGVAVLGHHRIDAAIMDKLLALGIKGCATRTVGYDHLDTAHGQRIGLRLCNANYPPNGVADYTLMLMLMSIRHYKQAMWRTHVNDYSLVGLIGREMKDLTVGIIGTGRIGKAVVENLSGFGCRILAHDVFRDADVARCATYVELDELYRECDLISLHTPLLPDTEYMINDETLAQMKDGVVLVNCARGELMDVEALIRGVESRKIGALALDVIEGEQGIYHVDRRTDIIRNQNMAYLRQFPNVILSQHLAFYTDTAVQSMVQCAVRGLSDIAGGRPCRTEILPAAGR